MWTDPKQYQKRKPNSLGGTPVQKYFLFKIFVPAVIGYCVFVKLLLEIPFMKKKRETVTQKIIDYQEKKSTKHFLSDPLVQAAIVKKKRDYAGDPKDKFWY